MTFNLSIVQSPINTYFKKSKFSLHSEAYVREVQDYQRLDKIMERFEKNKFINSSIVYMGDDLC